MYLMSMLKSYVRTANSSWRNQAPALRVMRLWLGITWIYAGWDKASDPGFLEAGSSTYMGTQLSGFSTHSPVGFAFDALIENASLVGGFVILSEFAIGLATLLWVAPRLAAFGGFLMSLGLWLADTFHVSPYFLASNTAYAVLWLSYLLLLIGNGKRKVFTMSLERRSVLRVGITGALAVAFAGAGRFFAKAAPATSTSAAGKGTKIVKLTSLKVGATRNFIASNGAPAILFRTKTGVFAYSAICTHQGCTVAYSAASKTMKCPCHQAEFDPNKSARVVSGPAVNPLGKIKVAVKGAWVIEA
jgi:thiosulfate dehydrogenase [quinone] large subunit